MNAVVRISFLLYWAVFLYQPGISQTTRHNTSQADLNLAQSSQLQHSQESLNQSEETTLPSSQSDQDSQSVNHVQTQLNSSEETLVQNKLNQSEETIQQNKLKFNQSEETILQNKRKLNQSEETVLQNSQSDLNNKSLNQSADVQTQPNKWLNQSDQARDHQHNQSSPNSFRVREPAPDQDLHWLSDCTTLPQHLNLSYLNLPHLPASLFNSTCAHKVLSLDLTGNRLTSLDPDLLTQLTSVLDLKVSNNQITQFSGKALKALKYLDLSHNHLQSLHADSIPSTLHYLDVSFNRLTKLNMGVFRGVPNLSRLNLAHNQLQSLPADSLPFFLFYLDVSFNALTQLGEGLFRGISYLESLNVSHNGIQDIHPRAFHPGMPWVVLANFSHNRLTAFDGWPYIFSRYIIADFTHNAISRFTNRMNITVLTECMGSVDLRYNNLTHLRLSNLTIYLNGTPITPMIIAFYFQVKLQHNPFVCDCNLHWIVQLFSEHLLSYSDEFYDFLTCASPPFLRGRILGFLLHHPYLLVCEVREGCPRDCQCMNTPHHGHVLVWCDPRLHNYTTLPAQLPTQGLVFLNLSNHALSRLEAGQCDVSRIKVLDVSHNQVSEVSPSFLKRASHLEEVNLRHNLLTSLTPSLRQLSVDRLHIAGNPLQCSCPLAKFGHWANAVAYNASRGLNVTNTSHTYSGADVGTELLGFLSAEDSSSADHLLSSDQSAAATVTPDLLIVNCSLSDGRQVALADTSQWGMDCQSLRINVHVLVWSGVMVALLMVGVGVCWRWRYSIRVLFSSLYFRTPVQSLAQLEEAADNDDGRTLTTEVTSPQKYHLYISVDEQDDASITWVVEELLPMLETKGRNSLRVYLPIRQAPIGGCMQEDRAEAISSCLKFLVVLTAGYTAQGLCRWELDFACHHHQQLCHRNIVIVLREDPRQNLPLRIWRTLRGPQVIHDLNHHNDTTNDQSDEEDRSEDVHQNNNDEETGDDKGDVPPRHTSMLEGAGVESQDYVYDSMVVDEAENHTSRGAEAINVNGDIAEHPLDICSNGENERKVSVRNGQRIPQYKTDRLFHTKALSVGTHYPPPQRPATYIPMHNFNPDVHTARNLSTIHAKRSVSSGQIPVNPNHERVPPNTLPAADKPEPKIPAYDKNDDGDEIAEDTENSKGNRRSKKEKKNDSARTLLPEKDREKEGSKQAKKRQQTTHRQRPGKGRRRQDGHKEGQRVLLEELSQFWEEGQAVAVEPLRSFLLQGRYLSVTGRLFKHTLLFELSRK